MDDIKNIHAKAYFLLVNRVGRIEKTVKKSLKPFSITHTQLNILSVLTKSHPEPMTAKAIKEKLIVVSPDLTRLIDRLLSKKLVKRKTCKENRRSVDISITEEGIELYRKAHIAVKRGTDFFYKNSITKEEAEQLTKILTKIEK